MSKLKLKTGDNVYIISGRSKGKTGEIIKVLPSARKVLVKGVNIVHKHQKSTQNASGGIVKIESFIDISNVMMLDPKLTIPTRVGFRFGKNDKLVRFCKKSDLEL